MTTTTSAPRTQTIYVPFSLQSDQKLFTKSLRNYTNVYVNEIVELKNIAENKTILVKVVSQTSDWLTTFTVLD